MTIRSEAEVFVTFDDKSFDDFDQLTEDEGVWTTREQALPMSNHCSSCSEVTGVHVRHSRQFADTEDKRVSMRLQLGVSPGLWVEEISS